MRDNLISQKEELLVSRRHIAKWRGRVGGERERKIEKGGGGCQGAREGAGQPHLTEGRAAGKLETHSKVERERKIEGAGERGGAKRVEELEKVQDNLISQKEELPVSRRHIAKWKGRAGRERKIERGGVGVGRGGDGFLCD